MAYNYNVSGLDVDFGALMAQKAKKEAYEEEKETSRLARDRELKYSNLYNEYEKTKNPALLRNMARLNPVQTKQIVEINEKLGEQEKASLSSGIIESKANFTAGNVKQSRQFWLDRGQILSKNNSDSSFTAPIIEAALNATDEEFEKVLNIGFNTSIAMGVIPQGDDVEIGDYFDADGNQYSKFYNKTYGTTHDVLTGQTLESIEKENILKNAGKKDNLKYTQDHTQLMFDKSESMDENNRLYSKAIDLEKKFTKIAAKGDFTEQGLASRIQDTIEDVLGTQDVENFARRSFTGYVNNRVVADRPPGAMSNFEFKELKAGYPAQGANPAMLVKFFNQAARASKLTADLDRIHGEFIEKTYGMFSARKDATVDGIKIKEGESMYAFQNRWLDRENAREGEKKKKEEEDEFIGFSIK
tara:strand:- start:2564 stop:3808 length:1245 start_codon:yes stop_codon:yes gene_type:complete